MLFGEAANNGQVIGAMKSGHKVVEGFDLLAQMVSGMELAKPKKKGAEEPKSGGLLSFLKRKGKD